MLEATSIIFVHVIETSLIHLMKLKNIIVDYVLIFNNIHLCYMLYDVKISVSIIKNEYNKKNGFRQSIFKNKKKQILFFKAETKRPKIHFNTIKFDDNYFFHTLYVLVHLIVKQKKYRKEDILIGL
jgi:hypothetical protein